MIKITDMYKVTVGIPLFRSAPFLDIILENIRAMDGMDVEVLISDRHCHDDTLDRLSASLSGQSNVRYLKGTDGLDWVGNINLLLQESTGAYFRFLPHDDLSPKGSLEALVRSMDADPDSILAYGPTKAIDLGGNHLPLLDKPAPHPVAAAHSWNLDLTLRMKWVGYFDGAFKGLIRMKQIRERGLFIRSSRDQIWPERCWLFALMFHGRFIFVQDALYIKRFYSGSVHSQWRINGTHYLSVLDVMQSYVRDVFSDPDLIRYCCEDIRSNAERLAAWADAAGMPRPEYMPFAAEGSHLYRSLDLPVGR
jgi:glycosyltransferase involved in cell wall biosynthesis